MDTKRPITFSSCGRRRPIMFLCALVYVCLLAVGHISAREPAKQSRSSLTVSLLSFGARPNDPGLNSRLPFQRALEKLSSQGGGTLSIPAGDYYLDFPDVASDADPNDSRNIPLLKDKPLKKEKLILVPPGILLQGTLDRDGKPASRIHWTATGFPLFSFVAADSSGVENVAFVFGGVQPQFFPWSQENFLDAVGYRARWLGGPYEISAVLFSIGSSNLRFENLTFRSGKTPADNEHTFAFGIVLEGKNPVPQPDPASLKNLPVGTRTPGGGLYECVTNNSLRSLHFEDFVMGILSSGQCGAVFENIEGNNRGSWYRSFNPSRETGREITNIGPPGHLIYLTVQIAYDVVRSEAGPNGEQVFHSTTRSKNVVLRNIKEGPDTLSNVNSLGTLALKNLEDSLISGVVSHHPSGLIQTMIDVHDTQLENLNWSSDRDICDEAPSESNCGVPVIALVPGPAETDKQFNSGVRFKNVTLQSRRHPSMFRIAEESGKLPLSSDIAVDGLTLECNPKFESSQGGALGVITLRSAGTHLTNVRYVPLITANETPTRENYAALILSRSSDTTIEMAIDAGRETGNSATAHKCMVEDQRNPVAAANSTNRCAITQMQSKNRDGSERRE